MAAIQQNECLEHAMEEMKFSARAHDRILKVARTLADIAVAATARCLGCGGLVGLRDEARFGRISGLDVRVLNSG